MGAIEWWNLGWAIISGTVACVFDLRYRKIPNWLTFSTMAAGVAGYLCFDRLHWATPWLGIGVGLLVLLIPFMVGGMGAGDVKLMMALGALLGPQRLFQLFLFAGIVGGILALVEMIYRLSWNGMALRLKVMIEALWDSSQRALLKQLNQGGKLHIPYGVSILIGLILEIVILGTGGSVWG